MPLISRGMSHIGHSASERFTRHGRGEETPFSSMVSGNPCGQPSAWKSTPRMRAISPRPGSELPKPAIVSIAIPRSSSAAFSMLIRPGARVRR